LPAVELGQPIEWVVDQGDMQISSFDCVEVATGLDLADS